MGGSATMFEWFVCVNVTFHMNARKTVYSLILSAVLMLWLTDIHFKLIDFVYIYVTPYKYLNAIHI